MDRGKYRQGKIDTWTEVKIDREIYTYGQMDK